VGRGEGIVTEGRLYAKIEVINLLLLMEIQGTPESKIVKRRVGEIMFQSD
jgi:hypothetical protein